VGKGILKNYNMNLLTLTIVALIFYGIGEILSKYYTNTSLFKYAVLAVLSDLIVYILWLPALQQKNSIALLGTMWTLCFAIISIFVGLIVFKENIYIYNYIGLCLAVISLYFLCR
jgi:hypothetical protein